MVLVSLMISFGPPPYWRNATLFCFRLLLLYEVVKVCSRRLLRETNLSGLYFSLSGLYLSLSGFYLNYHDLHRNYSENTIHKDPDRVRVLHGHKV